MRDIQVFELLFELLNALWYLPSSQKLCYPISQTFGSLLPQAVVKGGIVVLGSTYGVRLNTRTFFLFFIC